MIGTSQRHDRLCDRCPPMVGPTVGASVAIRQMIGETTLRCAGGSMVKAAARRTVRSRLRCV